MYHSAIGTESRIMSLLFFTVLITLVATVASDMAEVQKVVSIGSGSGSNPMPASTGQSCNKDDNCNAAKCINNLCCFAEGAGCRGLNPSVCCPGTSCNAQVGLCLSPMTAQNYLRRPAPQLNRPVNQPNRPVTVTQQQSQSRPGNYESASSADVLAADNVASSILSSDDEGLQDRDIDVAKQVVVGQPQSQSQSFQSQPMSSQQVSATRGPVGAYCNDDDNCYSATCVYNTCCWSEGCACTNYPGACCPGMSCIGGACVSPGTVNRRRRIG